MKTLAAALLILLCSCSIFQPRNPEDPDPDPGMQWQVPVHPSIVLSNLQNSIRSLSINYYMACFHENFVFLADPLDISDPAFQGYNFSNWTKSVEMQTASSIMYQALASGFSPDSLSGAMFERNSSYPPDPPVPYDTATVYRDYIIVAAGTLGCGWENPARGAAEITMVEEDGLWSILIWDDSRVKDYTGENFTWGVAKVFYR
jgi:hypothetical protein